ncbi:MAG: hypothetical protein ACJASQ_001982 [Crocinitomicaceae bacterium]|jgi:hypothetical protein
MKSFSFFLVFLLAVSCASEASDSSKPKDENEKFPKVNIKDYKTVTFEEEFEILILKELTLSSEESDKAILGYSHLSKEKHVYIEKESVTHYSKSLKARNVKTKSILESFAKEHLNDFKGVLKQSTESKFEKSKVGKLACLRSSFEGNSYGFPRTKYFSVRYFMTDAFIYMVMTWTVSASKKEFSDESLAMGLSFKVN